MKRYLTMIFTALFFAGSAKAAQEIQPIELQQQQLSREHYLKLAKGALRKAAMHNKAVMPLTPSERLDLMDLLGFANFLHSMDKLSQQQIMDAYSQQQQNK